MSIFAHLETLEEKHARLEMSIAQETARPLPDFSMITSLKKQKLHIKEEMERINHTRYRDKTAEAM